MNKTEEKPGFWAIVSMFGHQVLAGFVDEFTMGGSSFLRIAIPETARQQAWTRLFTDKSVYSMDPCDEANARYRAEQNNVSPMEMWDAKTFVFKELERSGKVIVLKEDLPEGFLEKKGKANHRSQINCWN